MSKNQQPLTCVLDRIEGREAVLVFEFYEKRRELVVPLNYLPKKSKEGDIFNLELFPAVDATKRRENLAREILKEILNGDEK